MSVLSALDALIAASVASYKVTEDAPKASAPKAPKAPKVERAPKASGSSDNTVSVKATVKVIGTVGTLDATAFTLAMRNAGKRPNAKGVMITDPSKVKEDEVKAIGDFIGYDVRLPHGENLFRANMAAKRSSSDNAGPTRSEVRRAQASITGFVAGMPDWRQRQIQDLKAREKLVVTSIEGHFQQEQKAKTQEERHLHAAQILLDQACLEDIRAQLDRLA